jgi:molybdopterin-guanine dinucleotide biosynthesis protein A
VHAKLPVHGFVLAGGKSTRMGEDKALLHFCGRPMVEIAVEKLRSLCADVGVAGNRGDLASYGRITHEVRSNAGPAAGIEAGLLAATQPWVLFVPVDVPLIPPEVLRTWIEAVIAQNVTQNVAQSDAGIRASYLMAGGEPQPAFCILRRECLRDWSEGLDSGERRLLKLLGKLGPEDTDAVRATHVESFASMLGLPVADAQIWFLNVNTLQELADAEESARRIRAGLRRDPDTVHPGVHRRRYRYE